ncbi:hypothetical protein SAMN05421806_13230 [Streptomyces indicus]|uniref:Uncharacterized protein n=1 Tax=Streptomyces indicus TaxID=417292 RepID=A0A1G9JM04_9ACTN|nr:hypothetical protein SAMN05421806_13230 [Streptomyces indicus]
MSMDAVFGDALATRGRGAGTGKPEKPVPATFTAPGVPAPAGTPEVEAAPETEAGAAHAPAEGGVPPIGGKVFDVNSNNGEGGAPATTEAGGAAEAVSPLSEEDRLLLSQCEGRIQAFGKAAADAGEAFDTIKNKELHRHYRMTWAEYTLARWGVSVSQVDRLIAAAPVMRELSIPNEGTARELVPAYRDWGADSARALWKGTKEGSGNKPTAKVLKAAVQSAKERVGDGNKVPAPDKLESLARKTVARVVKEEEAARAKKAAAKKAPAPAPAAAGEAEGNGTETSTAPTGEASAWVLPDSAVTEFSRLFVSQAEATGRPPEEIAIEAYDVLRKHYGAAADQSAA